MFSMFYLLYMYVALSVFMLQVFRVLEVRSESHWGVAWTPHEGAR
jgi:hypothetical protein